MCAEVDHCAYLLMNKTLLRAQYERRNSWTHSISSSSTSSNNTTPSWLERKLFSHLKRFFRRKSFSSTSNSSISSRRPSSAVEEILSASASINEQSSEAKEEEEEEEEEKEKEKGEQVMETIVAPVELPPAKPIDFLYDYDRLLARCLARREQDHMELLQRCQTPISIPHADLSVGQSRTIVLNWKSYIRLLHSLTRDPHLFQQYISESYSCQTAVNQREQLILSIRTTRSTFDHLLRKFLDEYVTCLNCQTAQTHLIKSDGIWQVECQLCGSQRTVKRLRWKHHQH